MQLSILLTLLLTLTFGLAACTNNDPEEITEDPISVEELTADLQARFAREDAYDFTDPLNDVPRDHTFTFDMTYEAMEAFRELTANADNDDGWRNMVRIYRDSAMTQEVPFLVGGDEEDFTYVTFSPFRNPIFALYDPAIGRNLFDRGEWNDWGNANQYFLVKYYDLMTGDQLADPQVTVFNVATEIAGAPRVNFNVTDGGVAGLNWDAVAGADEYAVVLVTENKDGDDIGRQVEIIARTTENYWHDISTEPGRNNQNFRIHQVANHADALYRDYREQINAGEMTLDEFAQVAAQYNFEEERNLDRNTYLAVIAMNDEGTSSISNLIDRRDVASQVPMELASWMNEGGIRPTFIDGASRAQIDRDILLVPSHAWVIMADGRATQQLVNYDIEQVHEGTQLVGNFVLDDDGEMVLDSTEEVAAVTVPYMIEGTTFAGYAQILRYDERTFEDDLQELARRQDGLRSRTGDIERSVNLNPNDEEANDNDADEDQAEADTDSSDEVATTLRGDFDIRASSPLSAYLALQMLNSQTRVSLSDFPQASDHEYLVEAWFEAVLQNPLVLGARSIELDWITGDLLITYDHDAETQQRQQQALKARVDEIVNEIITDGMTDLEMQTAINDFLIENATYDFDALDNAAINDFLFVDPTFYDSFTAYGILMNGVGVCSGYADAFTLIADRAGLESVIVTGFLQGSLPHAWNRVNIDGNWYTLDVTNNDNEFFPNAFFNLSDQEAATILTEDTLWILDSELPRFVAASSAGSEYYRYNNRFFELDEIVDALVEGIETNGVAIYRTDIMLTEEQFMMISLEVVDRTGSWALMGSYFLGIIHLSE